MSCSCKLWLNRIKIFIDLIDCLPKSPFINCYALILNSPDS